MKALSLSCVFLVLSVLLFLNAFCLVSIHSDVAEDSTEQFDEHRLNHPTEEVYPSEHDQQEDFEHREELEVDESEEEGEEEFVEEESEEEEGEFIEEGEPSDKEIPPGDESLDQEEVNYLPEIERVAKFHEHYVWPYPDDLFVPSTPGFVSAMRNRLDQIAVVEDINDRYTGFETVATTGFIVPNFTEHGFGLARCIDDELMDKLRTAVHEGMGTAELEGEDIIMPGPNPPILIRDRDDLLGQVATEMQRYAETWAGRKLLPYGAYGFRVYRNETQLMMHIDRPKTHIISFILHIDHSDDGEPWPLVIEDYHGNTHEVSLTSGDLLFYESAKLLHGRPRPLNGSWYCSVFVHYFPPDWGHRNINLEASFAVPPGWDDDETSRQLRRPDSNAPRMKLFETGFTEPDCPHQWCGLRNSIKWSGPAEPGVWHAPNFEKYPFDLPPYGIAVEEL